MAMVECPNCGAYSNSDFGACLKCHTDLSPTGGKRKSAQPEARGKSSGQKYGKSDWMAALVLFPFILAFFFWIGQEDSPEEIAAAEAERSQRTCVNKIKALVISQQFTERNLRSPSTADFPLISDSEVTVNYQGDCQHQVTSYVDSQNGFGAIVRQNYAADVRYNMDSDNWTLISLEFE